MRLESVELVRFKAFERAAFHLAPLTIAIGPNNAGKSSLLQALGLLGQSVPTGGIATAFDAVDLGPDVGALTHSRPSAAPDESSWELKLHWDDQCLDSNGTSPATDVRLDLHVDSGAVTSSPSTEVTVTLNAPGLRETVLSARHSGSGQAQIEAQFSIKERSPEGHENVVPIGQARIFARGLWSVVVPGRGWPEMVSGGHPETSLWQTAAKYLEAVPAALQAFRYIGPERAVGTSVYPLGAAGSPNPRTASEVLDTLAYDKGLLQAVSARCLSVFDFGIDISLLPNRQVALMAVSPGNASINAVNVGSGLVQLIWIVLQLEIAQRHALPSGIAIVPTVGVEEPEIHLHPAKQPDMARILVDYATRGTRILCTTQSEHLLMAFLQMVLAGELDREQLAVYYIEGGKAQRLEVDEQGRLSEGLRGFFEANEQELIRQMELLMRRV